MYSELIEEINRCYNITTGSSIPGNILGKITVAFNNFDEDSEKFYRIISGIWYDCFALIGFPSQKNKEECIKFFSQLIADKSLVATYYTFRPKYEDSEQMIKVFQWMEQNGVKNDKVMSAYIMQQLGSLLKQNEYND